MTRRYGLNPVLAAGFGSPRSGSSYGGYYESESADWSHDWYTAQWNEWSDERRKRKRKKKKVEKKSVKDRQPHSSWFCWQ